MSNLYGHSGMYGIYATPHLLHSHNICKLSIRYYKRLNLVPRVSPLLVGIRISNEIRFRPSCAKEAQTKAVSFVSDVYGNDENLVLRYIWSNSCQIPWRTSNDGGVDRIESHGYSNHRQAGQSRQTGRIVSRQNQCIEFILCQCT